MTKPADAQAAMYRSRARAYHELVRAEDCDGALGPALVARLHGCARILEVGAGTGRVTALLPRDAAILATEREAAMLSVAREHLGANVALVRADARCLPLSDGSVDAVVAGWVFGHLRLWMPAGWREEVARALDEAERVLRDGGRIVVLETLGTGTPHAAPPSEALAEYYRFLEEDRGFARETIATDYRFDDPEHAVRVMEPFFGASMAARIRENAWSRVPEHTGVWTWPADGNKSLPICPGPA